MTGSAFANGPPPDGRSTVLDAGTAEHARAFVRLENERGVDFIKVYDPIPREAYFALADEANQLGIPFAGHVPAAVRASEVSDAGQRSTEHCCAGNVLDECSASEVELRGRVVAELESEQPKTLPLMLEMVESYDAEKCAALFARFVENETWFTPTLMPNPLPNPRGGGRSLAPRPSLEVRAPGRTGIEEVGLMVRAGLTEAEALRAATLSPAEYPGAADSLGTVEEGKLADLVLLGANPLEDIANTRRIRAVVADGRLYRRHDLNRLLAEVEAAVHAVDDQK